MIRPDANSQESSTESRDDNRRIMMMPAGIYDLGIIAAVDKVLRPL